LSQIKIKIFIVDDDLTWSKKLASFLNNEPDFCVIGIVQSQKEAEEFIGANYNNIDVVLMDLNLGGESDKFEGIEIIEKTNHLGNLKVIIVTAFTLEELVIKSFMAGAKNYFPKEYFKELPSAIRGVVSNDFSAMDILLKEYLKVQEKNVLSVLSPTESRVYNLIEQGYSTKQMADELCITIETVRAHIHKILTKLNLKTRKQQPTNQSMIKSDA
jgi:DNA-binding NarL/FixJ family response regulator